MASITYLQKGLWALARAHRANTMAGHLGAALVAGYCFSEQHPELDGVVHAGIEGELDRVVAGEEQWFDPKTAGFTVAELFEPLPDTTAQPERTRTIAEALARNIDELHQSGHNVIFAALALRALRDHPELATAAIVDGIAELTEGFNGTRGGRQYFGKDRGWLDSDDVTLPADDLPPPYAGTQAMARVVLDQVVRTATEHRQGCGGLYHVINHAAGLADLWQLGYEELARRGFAAHRHHVRIWRVLPNLEDELGKLTAAEHDPLTPPYWTTGTWRRDSALLTHRVKTLYGFQTLLKLVDDAALRQAAEQKFLYLMT